MNAEGRLSRSEIMSRICGRDTGPELAVRRLAFAAGYRFRLHQRNLPGTPDLVFFGRRKVIFVHGCFWHSHNCRRGESTPKTNAHFWASKRSKNIERDKASMAGLRRLGWRTLVIWECELKESASVRRRLIRFLGAPSLKHSSPPARLPG